MRIILVRHAAPIIPAPGGPSELVRPLTPAGMEAAAALAPELAALEPSVVVSSPYLRAVQTVRPAAELLGLPVRKDIELREWDSGLRPRPDYARLHAASWADPTLARPGGESLEQLGIRATAALRQLPDGALVGSHGTFIARALIGSGYPVDWEFAQSMPMPAVYVLTWANAAAAAVTGPGL